MNKATHSIKVHHIEEAYRRMHREGKIGRMGNQDLCMFTPPTTIDIPSSINPFPLKRHFTEDKLVEGNKNTNNISNSNGDLQSSNKS